MVRNLTDRLITFLGGGRRPPAEVEDNRDFCIACSGPLAGSPLYQQYRVCPSCRFHYSVTARERISLLVDPGTFKESHRSIVSMGSQSLSSQAPQQRKLAREQRRTGLTEAVVTGTCMVGGSPVVLIALDFRFVGGSLGGVVGEKVALAFETAARRRMPVVAVATSGRTRMQEGIISLMQMAKTAFAINGLAQRGIPFIAVLANPTTGQVYSSLARQADVILAEPGAMLGLAPPRALGESSPEVTAPGLYAAEAYMARGMVDRVVDREHLRGLLSVLLHLLRLPDSSGSPAKNENTAAIGQEEKVRGIIQEEDLEELWPQSWSAVQVTLRGQRPTSSDYARRIFTSFVELHGDRLYGDDPSIVAGLGFLGSQVVAVIGQEKGHELTARERHEGRTLPEGYRKAQRVMGLASRLLIPLITLIDTPGPYYGRESEERGLGSAMSSTMAFMAQLPIPTISAIIGEGGSEGALALGVADRVLMLENAQYMVTSPEDAAALLYRDLPGSQEVPEPSKLSARECQELGIIDIVIPEPDDGAHRNPEKTANRLKSALEEELDILRARTTKRVLRDRYRKYRNMGEYSSYFRVAVASEVSHLQGYVAQGARLIRRRRRRRQLPPPNDREG
ncbi:MAG: acetyl-CoA carboxylase carboxyl transferase subunit beta [Chloroflexi bacterium]|nr:acetyl-CoA carboxylase carboxyl transferase subunit beta [Chloroflexota bacterium]